MLAGPFAAHQLGFLGADVIKLEEPNDPVQARMQGSDPALTGTEVSGPLKCGTPVIDHATGTTAAFAITAALLQRTRTGRS